ncbi:MAG: hypothetical protein B655_2199 [Methanobacterium sp. Maddingley MBC34]|nr:MAG: hypothetical protein B655_2199 [Methanobacterium sp. Maddingley MBC34]
MGSTDVFRAKTFGKIPELVGTIFEYFSAGNE